MLADGREHPLLSPEGVGHLGRVLEVFQPEANVDREDH
jgi:hypothetical protein